MRTEKSIEDLYRIVKELTKRIENYESKMEKLEEKILEKLSDKENFEKVEKIDEEIKEMDTSIKVEAIEVDRVLEIFNELGMELELDSMESLSGEEKIMKIFTNIKKIFEKKDAEILDKERELETLNSVISRQEKEKRIQEDRILENGNKIKKLKLEISNQEEKLLSREQEIRSKEEEIRNLESQVSSKKSEIKNLGLQISSQEEKLSSKEREIETKEKEIKDLELKISLKEKELLDKKLETENLKEEKEEISELYEVKEIYDLYLQVSNRTRDKLKTLIRTDDVITFILSCSNVNDLDSLWDTVNLDIKKTNLEDCEKLATLFRYFIERINKAKSESLYRLIDPKKGDEFDPTRHTSLDDRGDVSEVIFPGYAQLEPREEGQEEEDREIKKIKKYAIVKRG